jgi:predicted glycogen debranching enzyme
MIQFAQTTCTNLEAARSREWLETNGIGGYSSSTIVGLNTRRYHGLLVAATCPPVGRIVMLSKIEETLVINGRRYDLSTNQYPGAIHPQGFNLQTGFRLDPFPIFTYQIDGITIEKSVFMIYGENSVAVRYQVEGIGLESKLDDDGLWLVDTCVLELSPLLAYRDYHSLARETGAINSDVLIEDRSVAYQPFSEMPALYFAHCAGEVEKTGHWYRDFEYSIERERGFDFTEDLFNPLALKFDLRGRSQVDIIASTERRNIGDVDDIDRYQEEEVQRRLQISAGLHLDDEFVCALEQAADQFIVSRDERKTVIAGYHWFSDWGRDTMIALPGLTLTTGRPEIAKSILLEFARYVDRGMLPNRFPDAGETPEYNSVDATLWFFEAVRALIQHTGDYEFARSSLYDVMADIIDWHVRGTRYNIHVDHDGLLAAGEEGSQLTWMDAKVGDWVVTPRRGKPVEIQALWYNALRVMEDLARRFDHEEQENFYGQLAEKAQAGFNRIFWNDEAGCLYDVVDGERCDASIRPNQILAVSLAHTMISADRAALIVEKVGRELLTPFGLRTLSPSDPRYRGRYEGDPLSRDGAYHQGTVWAWLMGPFVTAFLRVFGESDDARRRAAAWLEPFREHLREAGLGQISEIFDGDPPHTPRGCIAQAWSVAEILRVAVEEVYTPRHATNRDHTHGRTGSAEGPGTA